MEKYQVVMLLLENRKDQIAKLIENNGIFQTWHPSFEKANRVIHSDLKEKLGFQIDLQGSFNKYRD